MANGMAKSLTARELAFKTRQRIVSAQHSASAAISAANAKTKAIVGNMAENTVLEKAAEAGGMFGEAIAKIKAPEAHKYVPVAGLVVELWSVYMMTQRLGTAKRLTEFKVVGALGSGMRARASIELMDKAAASLFEKK